MPITKSSQEPRIAAVVLLLDPAVMFAGTFVVDSAGRPITRFESSHKYVPPPDSFVVRRSLERPAGLVSQASRPPSPLATPRADSAAQSRVLVGAPPSGRPHV